MTLSSSFGRSLSASKFCSSCSGFAAPRITELCIGGFVRALGVCGETQGRKHARDVRVLRAPGERKGCDVRSAETLRKRIELADLLLLLLALRRLELLDAVLVERGVRLEARVLRNAVLYRGHTISLAFFNVQRRYSLVSWQGKREGGQRKATHHVFSGKVATRERRPDRRAVAVLLEQRSVFDLKLLAVEQAV